MSERYDVMFGQQNGEKTFWTKCGIMMPAKSGNGWSLNLSFVPVGFATEKGGLWLKAFPQRERQEGQRGGYSNNNGNGGGYSRNDSRPMNQQIDDDVPF
jgi:hypothetical protein